MIEIKKASNKFDYQIIEKLAREILHEVYASIISTDHTDHFLESYQTEEAIASQIDEQGFSYFLFIYDQDILGYLGLQKLGGTLVLSKLYILSSYRGLKIGKRALEYVDDFAQENEVDKIELIVNQ